MGELKPYPEYKDSKMEWLGKIPKHWEEKRAKYYFREVDERSKTGKEELLSVSHITGVTPRSQKNITMFKAESYVGYKLCKPGDLAVNTMWAWMGALGVSKYFGIISSGYAVYRPIHSDDHIPEYIDYLFRTPPYTSEYYSRSTGIRSSRFRLYPEIFLKIPVLCPTKEEQEKIVAFLRQENRKIEEFIRSKRRLIELLNEQKQVIISRAVTRGLDPNVRLKPSGIEWLGDVPEHWDIKRIRDVSKLIVSNVDKHSIIGEIPVRLCNYTDVYKNEFITSDLPFMHVTASGSEILKYRIFIDDVLITKDSEEWQDIGVPAYVEYEDTDLICGYHLAIIRPNPSIIRGRYLHWQLMSHLSKFQFSVRANGVTRYGLSHGAIKDIMLLIPSLSEQSQIVEYINSSINKLKNIIIKTNREITLLQEYRTRLISDVVNGKIDVRNIQIDTNIRSDNIKQGD